jgi:hypothetical protein
MNPFELKAQPKAENILANYDYCLVTPVVEDGPFELNELDSVKCTDLDTIKDMYYEYYDVMIETPDRCNY